MPKGEITRMYGRMSEKDRQAFDRWLVANAVIGSLFAAALFLMAMAETSVGGLNQAAADSATVGAARSENSGAPPPHELTARSAPDRFPLQRVRSPF